ncbi:MAG: hypothetical protein U5R48_01530 [Gammaproteobacteria bacterium]|nr:hypothetical protein [Gammaproteobacteria bacterium]
MNGTEPASLGGALLAEPLWLQGWVLLLVVVHLLAIVFVVGREDGARRVRAEPVAILASFLVAAILMEWLFQQYGYVRLLGLAHLLGWTPVYVWVLLRRRRIGLATLHGRWIHAYLLIAGLSLIIDAVDVVRWLLGDGAF